MNKKIATFDKASTVSSAELLSVDLQITGMHCQSCELLIKDELQELPGVSEIKVDYKTGLANLLLDELQSSPAAVLAAVSKAGYTAMIKPISRDNYQQVSNEIVASKNPTT